MKRSRLVLVLLCCLSVTAIGASRCRRRHRPPPPPTLKVQQLQVSRYTTAVLDEARADAIFADATTVLQTNDGPGDVACQIQLVRSGAVGTFSTGTGSIDSNADFQSILGVPGNVKVVNTINWCGGFIPNVIGCSPVPGISLVVVRFTPNQEGILWDHEYGHNKGLQHRNDATAVMNPMIDLAHRVISAAECNAYRN